ncbi:MULTISPECIES: P-loop NTPase fold protein [Trichocoleus]|uniref:KAP family NTPase n=1 Tax=Trichocoleus desertorum GB2-A4 TaxID=2933944 RepID=A0ABV0JBU6_9CYAN|nr:P-loop NTPase fold protein [Trichocoleus sp. FACHB-46]MBD1865379.1 hypothetical protein [Trichocoleus sp. FACHB-46]
MTESKNKLKPGLERREIEKVLESFLDLKSEDKVLAIKGDWGVGKTHLVKEFLRKNEKEYYYDSVFGVSSVDELKMKLLSNFQPVFKKEENGFLGKLTLGRSVKYTKENSEIIGKIIEKAPMIGGIVSAVTSSGISLISNIIISKLLKGQLVCIDDIERKSEKLQLDELLGFIESLVEDQKCKVILIYYEDRIYEDAKVKKILEEYREKVIDIEIKFQPSVDENFYIAFGENDPDEKFILDYLTREGIQTNNIRVLKKLQWNLKNLRPYMENYGI